MTTPPYSEATVELVTDATEQHYLSDGQTDAMGNSACSCGQWWDAAGDNPGWDQHMAEVALGALAAAGRLLPEPVDTRTEWAVWWLGPNGGIRLSQEHLTSQTEAEQVAATRIGEYGIVRWELRYREHRDFADGSCWSGPWSAVPPEPKESA